MQSDTYKKIRVGAYSFGALVMIILFGIAVYKNNTFAMTIDPLLFAYLMPYLYFSICDLRTKRINYRAELEKDLSEYPAIIKGITERMKKERDKKDV